MSDEVPARSRREVDSGNAEKGSAGEQRPLQARAPFLQNWDWKLIDSLNRAACERGRAQYGHNSEAYSQVESKWEKTRREELSLQETLDFLRLCHRSAPFLFFNGNTFAEVARRLVDALLAEFPLSRRREASSLVAHYVAGVLDCESMANGLDSLIETPDFKPGDAVRTLKGSAHGIVRRILDDGRVVWRPTGTSSDLIALPESLLHRAKRRRK